jgi:hypothetical protein
MPVEVAEETDLRGVVGEFVEDVKRHIGR